MKRINFKEGPKMLVKYSFPYIYSLDICFNEISVNSAIFLFFSFYVQNTILLRRRYKSKFREKYERHYE